MYTECSPDNVAPLNAPRTQILFAILKAYGFYDDINKLLDFYLALVPADVREGAKKLVPAKRETLPKFLFKEGSVLMIEKVSIS